jgi:polyferredoxin
MLYTLAMRRSESISVIHDRNPIFVRLADGSIRNAFTVHVANKALETRLFELTVEGVPDLDVILVGDTAASGNPLIVVSPDQTREIRALLTTHAAPPAASVPLTFTITDAKDGSKATAVDNFRGP